MNGGAALLVEAEKVARALAGHGEGPRVAICAPTTLLHRLSRRLAASAVLSGGQDCHAQPNGPFTGDVSADMLVEAGARLVILGHSERRGAHRETDAEVAAKVSAAARAGLEPIICVGETGGERDAGTALDVIARQVRGSLSAMPGDHVFAVAYEPVWAIGTGRRASLDDVVEAHRVIRRELERSFPGGTPRPILYGGSVIPEAAAGIAALPEVGGLLVGGAALRADGFLRIIEACC
jgi:triosephosphate isomerase